MARAPRQLKLPALVAATYFMVSGGPYGLEELVSGAGYHLAILILVVTPLIWSVPTALMVGELSGAIPKEGGYYVWVRRALGPFGGFMEAWLSLVASVFDMAIYPTLFVLYLSRLWPAIGTGYWGTFVGVGMIALCVLWNLRGANSVGGGSLVMTILLLAPFAVMSLEAWISPLSVNKAALPVATGAAHGGLVAGILIAMWNYMGWDNASTIAGEVERPQRTYPLAMWITVVLVALTYVIPVAAAQRAGIDSSGWETGAWVNVAEAIGGHGLGIAVVLGGAVCAIGMFNALVMSYSRLPVALAGDGFLPAMFAKRDPKSGAPVAAIVACAVAYSLALRLGFARLVELDVMLYGLSLLLEFAALTILRIKEPALQREFRVPGGIPGTLLIAIGPTALIGVALVNGRGEMLGEGNGGISALTFGLLLIAIGPALYLIARWRRGTFVP